MVTDRAQAVDGQASDAEATLEQTKVDRSGVANSHERRRDRDQTSNSSRPRGRGSALKVFDRDHAHERPSSVPSPASDKLLVLDNAAPSSIMRSVSSSALSLFHSSEAFEVVPSHDLGAGKIRQSSHSADRLFGSSPQFQANLTDKSISDFNLQITQHSPHKSSSSSHLNLDVVSDDREGSSASASRSRCIPYTRSHQSSVDLEHYRYSPSSSSSSRSATDRERENYRRSSRSPSAVALERLQHSSRSRSSSNLENSQRHSSRDLSNSQRHFSETVDMDAVDSRHSHSIRSTTDLEDSRRSTQHKSPTKGNLTLAPHHAGAGDHIQSSLRITARDSPRSRHHGNSDTSHTPRDSLPSTPMCYSAAHTPRDSLPSTPMCDSSAPTPRHSPHAARAEKNQTLQRPSLVIGMTHEPQQPEIDSVVDIDIDELPPPYEEPSASSTDDVPEPKVLSSRRHSAPLLGEDAVAKSYEPHSAGSSPRVVVQTSPANINVQDIDVPTTTKRYQIHRLIHEATPPDLCLLGIDEEWSELRETVRTTVVNMPEDFPPMFLFALMCFPCLPCLAPCVFLKVRRRWLNLTPMFSVKCNELNERAAFKDRGISFVPGPPIDSDEAPSNMFTGPRYIYIDVTFPTMRDIGDVSPSYRLFRGR